MLNDAVVFLSTWWESVPASFAFLLMIPFAVAAIGLLGDAVRRRCRDHDF